MPFNQLLFPLLGGYLLINFTYIASYWASRQSKDQLLLASAIAGLSMGILARAIVLVFMLTPAGPWLYDHVHRAAPYEGIGTALLAFFLCVGFRYWINQVWPREDAGLWLYDTATYDGLEQLLMRSVFRVEPSTPIRSVWKELPLRLFASVPIIGGRARRKLADDLVELGENQVLSDGELIDVAQSPQADHDGSRGDGALPDVDEPQTEMVAPVPVMLILKDRKVYVGWVELMPPLRADDLAYLRIFPSWSGYRDPLTLTVISTTWYDKVSDVNIQGLPLLKIIPVSEIASASLYDPLIFEKFAARTPAVAYPDPEGTADHATSPDQ